MPSAVQLRVVVVEGRGGRIAQVLRVALVEEVKLQLRLEAGEETSQTPV